MDERQKYLFDKFTTYLPLMIALFAAVLSINDLMYSKYTSRMDSLASMRDRDYQWYQAKGIKSTQVEGQIHFFQAMMKTGLVGEKNLDAVKSMTEDLVHQVSRYEKERHEILLGSIAVGKENWSQEVDGVLGKVIGAKEYQGIIDEFKFIGVDYSYASMLLRICLALGAVGLMINQFRNKLFFFMLTVLTGSVGTVLFVISAVAEQSM